MTTLPDIQPAFVRVPTDGDLDLRDPAQEVALAVLRAAHQTIHGRDTGQVAVRSFARLDSDTDWVLFKTLDGKEQWRTAPVAWVLLSRAARHVGLEIVEFRRRLNTSAALRELGGYVLVFTVTTPDIAAKARARRPGEALDDFFYSLISTIKGARDFERVFSMTDWPATWPDDKADATRYAFGLDKGRAGGDRLTTQLFYIPEPGPEAGPVSDEDLARARDAIANNLDNWMRKHIGAAFGLSPDDLGVAKTKPRNETPQLPGGQDD